MSTAAASVDRQQPAQPGLEPVRLGSGQRDRTPFYSLVPKDFDANLRFRRDMIRLGATGRTAQQELWIMCSRDPLFYINTFVWTFDPRRNPSALPFITYEYQDEALLDMFKVLGNEDLAIEKSRDMGASWMGLLVFEHQWKFADLVSFLMVSRKEEYVDKEGDPKTLFWKLDFINQPEHMPRWLMPNCTRTKLHLRNDDTGSTIDGESTTGDVARGDRRTAILLDEFASVDNGDSVLKATADATNCRIFNSTPKGTNNAHYRIIKSDVRKLRMHWSRHPLKARGLYTTEKGVVKVLDGGYEYPANFQFILDGKLRSPWYDAECRRRPHPLEIAQELDIDYLGSAYQFFDSAVLDRIQNQDVRPPFMAGELRFDPDTCDPIEFVSMAKGRLKLWAQIDAAQRPQMDRDYSVAVDIAQGTGASNSAIVVGDRLTREKVAEFVSPRMRPDELACYAVALGKWFGGRSRSMGATEGAYMIWEANGPGRGFGDRVIELGYRNVYYRRNDASITKKVSDVPGWYSSKQTKLAVLGEYRRALKDGDFINRSYEAVEECREFIFTPDGSVEHSGAVAGDDPSGARENHGDRPTADALLHKAMKEVGGGSKGSELPVAPVGSFLYRRMQAQMRLRKSRGDVW